MKMSTYAQKKREVIIATIIIMVTFLLISVGTGFYVVPCKIAMFIYASSLFTDGIIYGYMRYKELELSEAGEYVILDLDEDNWYRGAVESSYIPVYNTVIMVFIIIRILRTPVSD